jgi:hypothetical protein
MFLSTSKSLFSISNPPESVCRLIQKHFNSSAYYFIHTPEAKVVGMASVGSTFIVTEATKKALEKIG